MMAPVPEWPTLRATDPPHVVRSQLRRECAQRIVEGAMIRALGDGQDIDLVRVNQLRAAADLAAAVLHPAPRQEPKL